MSWIVHCVRPPLDTPCLSVWLCVCLIICLTVFSWPFIASNMDLTKWWLKLQHIFEYFLKFLIWPVIVSVQVDGMLWDRRENVNRSEGKPILSPTLAVIGALACDSVWLPDAPTILLPASVAWPFTFSFSNPRFHTADVDFSHQCIPPAKPFHQRNFDHHQQKVQLPLKLSHISILASFRGRIRALMVSQPLIWTQQTAASPSASI